MGGDQFDRRAGGLMSTASSAGADGRGTAQRPSGVSGENAEPRPANEISRARPGRERLVVAGAQGEAGVRCRAGRSAPGLSNSALRTAAAPRGRHRFLASDPARPRVLLLSEALLSLITFRRVSAPGLSASTPALLPDPARSLPTAAPRTPAPNPRPGAITGSVSGKRKATPG